MKAIYLLMVTMFAMGFFRSSASTFASYEHWQCSFVEKKSIYESISSYVKSNFDDLGYYAAWMKIKLTFISCYEKGLIKVPQGLDNTLQSLDLRRNSITLVQKNDFLSYKKLEAIQLQENCLSANINRQNIPLCSYHSLHIENGSFTNLLHLKYIDISDNNIKTLAIDLPRSLRVLNSQLTILGKLHTADFQHLQFLETVFLGYNCDQAALSELCKNNFSIDSLTFTSKKFSHLEISYNNLKTVPRWLLNPSLQGLSLQGNPIHLIRPNDFQTCPNLTRLTLSWTSKFDRIPLTIMRGAFDSLNKLVVLELAGNMLETLPDFSIHPKPHLLGLGLAFNCLKMLAYNPIDISSTPLIGLQLVGNTFCSSETYPRKPKIHKLVLGEAFMNMTELQSLEYGATTMVPVSYPDMFWDLSYGYQYDIVDAESIQNLKHMPKLRTLSLALSGIRYINMRAFCMLNLTSLDLGINQIEELLLKDSRFRRRKRSDQTREAQQRLTTIKHHRRQYLNDVSDGHNYLILHRNAIIRLPMDAFKCFPLTSYLDLSYNQISYIDNDTFLYMKQLEILDLRFNPVRFIHAKSSKTFSHLNTLLLNYTTYQSDFTLHFLSHLSSSIIFEYSDITYNIYKLLAEYRKNSTVFSMVISIQITNIPIPVYDLTKNTPIFNPFPNLTNIMLTKAQLTTALGDNFFGGVTRVTNVTLRNCGLREYPNKALKKLPKLIHLDLSHNYIEVLNQSWFNFNRNLCILDLSHNFIRYIEPGTLQTLVKTGLQNIDFSYNFITEVGPSIISKTVLRDLRFLDLRKNMLSCDCTLKNNFGWYIYSSNISLDLPGFLPKCPAVVEDYYGGCLTCSTTISSQSRSLFLHSLTNTCEVHFLVVQTVSFTLFIICFQIFSLTYNSKSLKKRLIKAWSRNTILETVQSNPTDWQPKIYAYDGFVYFDKEDPIIGDWVDHTLVPTLENGFPSFRIGVAGKEEWCGDTQVKQLLLKLEASRKTIILLTENYSQSHECKYILSVLEEFIHNSGEDRSIIITFSQRPIAGSGFRMRGRRNQWSVLNLSDRNADNPLFWEMLRNAIIAL